ncbi:MAG: hypothetical protein ACQETZ_08145 [Candidatus Fermentibacterota bacterium]
MKRTGAAKIGAGLWTGACEFPRNELLLKDYWIDTSSGPGLAFPFEPVNGALWAVRSIPPAGSSPRRVTVPAARDGEL